LPTARLPLSTSGTQDGTRAQISRALPPFLQGQSEPVLQITRDLHHRAALAPHAGFQWRRQFFDYQSRGPSIKRVTEKPVTVGTQPPHSHKQRTWSDVSGVSHNTLNEAIGGAS
jgi:hypothetical protein